MATQNQFTSRVGSPSFPIREIRSGEKLSELIHKIGHDIGNPLTAIISIGSVIQTLAEFEQKSGENKMPYYAESIIAEAWKISRINERLVCLMSERPGAPCACGIKPTIINCLNRLKSRDKKKFQAIDVHIKSPGDSVEVLVDNNQLTLLVAEILHNSVESVERIHAAKGPDVDEWDDSIHVKIEEQGAMVSCSFTCPSLEPCPLDLADIFKPLCSAYPEEKRIGLGMTTAYAIADRYNGKIEVKEEPVENGGVFTTTFWFPKA